MAATDVDKLTDEVIQTFAMSRVFKSPPNAGAIVNGMDMDSTGQFMVTSSKDSCIRFYDCLNGRLKKTVQCKNYGTSCARFSHHNKSILVASPKDNAVRYHSLHDNKYIATFAAHTERVTGVEMSRINDTFMTAALDRSIRLWDIRQPNCIARLQVGARPNIALDYEGLIFAVGTGMNEVKLYDCKQYQNGPFATYSQFPIESEFDREKRKAGNKNAIETLSPPPTHQLYEWCDMSFSPDGTYLLISTRTNLLILMDAFEGTVKHTFESYSNKGNMDIHGVFTMDSKYVCAGSSKGDIHVWSVETGKEVSIWSGHPNPVRYVKWNPHYLSVASAGSHVALWLPDQNGTMHSKHNQSNIVLKSALRKQSNFSPPLTDTVMTETIGHTTSATSAVGSFGGVPPS